jgi:hypothetical protein
MSAHHVEIAAEPVEKTMASNNTPTREDSHSRVKKPFYAEQVRSASRSEQKYSRDFVL